MKLLNKKLSGDTLIEVLLGFVILSAVVSLAFTSVMGSYKTAQSAQARSQALFLAQYQADGLKTYRDSLEWDNSSSNASFLNGKFGNFGDDINTPALDGVLELCMEVKQDSDFEVKYWKPLKEDPSNCNSLAKLLANTLIDPTMNIKIIKQGSDNSQRLAEIVVEYKAPNASIREKVTNRILLTR